MPTLAQSRHLGTAFYWPNQFLITMPEDAPFFRSIEGEDNSTDNKYLPIFAHEYWHFLQNLTTVYGFRQFMFWGSVISLFSKALMKNLDGTTNGSSDLDVQDQKQLEATITSILTLEGDYFDPDVPAKITDFRVKSLIEKSKPVEFYGKPIENSFFELTLEIDTSDAQKTSITYNLGAGAIEESVAYLVESIIAKDISDFPEEWKTPPQFPYLILNKLFDYYLSDSDKSPVLLASIGTLALLCPNPGYDCIEILKFFSNEMNINKLSVGDSFRNTIKEFMPKIRGGFRTVTEDLQAVTTMHHRRGMNQVAADWIVDTFRRAITIRDKYPLFDLKFVMNGMPDLESWTELQEQFPACDVIQERPGDPDTILKDLLLGLRAELFIGEIELSSYLRSFQAHLHYAQLHLTHDGFVATSSIVADGEVLLCPFYNVCKIPWRIESQEICKNEPWKHFSRERKASCWFTNGIGSLMGLLDVKKIS